MTVYYVDATATGTADGLSEVNAFTTIDTAMNTVIAGDKVWVKASATYDENANIDTAGAINSWIEFEGYSSTIGDNGRPVWKNTSGSALTDTPAQNYYLFKNFDFDGSSSSAASISSQITYFYNCLFRNNGVHGVQVVNSNQTFVNCEFSGNSFDGLSAGAQNSVRCVGCKFFSNTSEGAVLGQYAVVYRCLFYNNVAAGSDCDISADHSWVVGNTFDGENGSGILLDLNAQYAHCVADNIFYDKTTAVFCSDTANTFAETAPWVNNLINSCTNSYYTGSVEWNTLMAAKGLNDVTGAPAFTDEAGDDYTLGTFSPAKDTGLYPGGIT